MKLYNTLTRSKDDFKPLSDSLVNIYTCGLTVYSQPHIGNWLGYIYWDVLVRTLTAEGYKVNRTQNITDVGHLVSDDDTGEDKMEKGAQREGVTAWDIADKYIAIADHEAYVLLGLMRPTVLARATDYIDQQIDFAKELEEKGYTYLINDGLYFDTSKLADYGKLAQLDIAGLEAGARVDMNDKRNPTDFAIWKLSPSDSKRDMEWNSPWGKGFPGWHLECSVIARETLGDKIDIHTGGIDHIPIHHTNEIAQTESLTGETFANYWLHNNHIKVDGQKMSKSLGNIYTLQDIIDRGFDIDAFKLLALSKHYRTEGNFTWEILEAAQNRLNNWRDYAALRHQTHDTLQSDDSKDSRDDTVSLLATRQAVIEKLRDDLNTPEALMVIDQAFNQLDNIGLDKIHRLSLVSLLETIDDALGLRLLDSTPDIDDETKRLIIERQQARQSKDWGRSDEIRDQLLSRGISLSDRQGYTVWTYSR